MFISNDWSAIVDRVPQSVNNSADHRIANRHLHDPARALNQVAFLDRLVLPKEHCANLVFLEIQSQSANLVRKLQQLASHYLFESMDFGNAVTNLDDCANLHYCHAGVKIFNLLADNFVNFVGSNWLHRSPLLTREFLA